MNYQLPEEIIDIIDKLEAAGFEAYAVGGAVRDLLLGRQFRDFDVATDATPEEILKTFPDSLYENRFGTVTVKTQNAKRKAQNKGRIIKEVQITTYRIEEKYTDKRHPDAVKFTTSLREDLARRDFTINAIAVKAQNAKRKAQNKGSYKFEIIDPFDGQKDLEGKLIRAVGDPQERFNEDALRLMRAIRFATELGFEIEKKTYNAIKDSLELLKHISTERIRDEFLKIINTREAAKGISLLTETGLLNIFLPELAEGIGVAQSKHHIYEVFEHHVRSLDYAARKNYSLGVRLAALFHDIGKPRTKRGEDPNATFYNHEIVGARITRQLMRRLKFPSNLLNKVYLLVRYHQFYYQAEEVTASSVRRLIKNVGRENIDELIQVREADRIGSGVPKAVPYKLRHLKFMVEKVSTDPISVKMLRVNGHDLMKELGIEPSRKLGLILNSLLAEVIDNPKKNRKDLLLKRSKELNKLSEEELQKNLDKIEQAQHQQEQEIKQKYYVK